MVQGCGDALVSASFSVTVGLGALDVKDQLQERNPVSSLVVDHSLVGNNGQFGHCVTTMQNSTDAGQIGRAHV